ncbi:MAG: ATP synthase subunit I [Desulfuromonadales bacterium]|jgi:hypothetical protein
MAPIDQLPAEMSRRNWLILALLLLGSLPFGSLQLSLGILSGGLVAIGGFLWLRRSLHRLLEESSVGGRFGYQFGYLIRLAVLAIILALLIAVIQIDLVGLLVGLSVVVLNLFWITLQRALR